MRGRLLHSQASLVWVLAMLGVGWVALAVGHVAEARRGSPEAATREYLVDLEAHRVEEALAAIHPDQAGRWRDFVEFQRFNRYEVISIAVRSPSVVESLASGQAWRAKQLTLVADITEPSGVRWRGTTVMEVTMVDGRWVMMDPPFAP